MYILKYISKRRILKYFKRTGKKYEEVIVKERKKSAISEFPKTPGISPSNEFKLRKGKIKYNEDIMINTTDEWEEI